MTLLTQVFAYGSLVGRRSRDFIAEATPATLEGWNRSWSHGIRTKRGNVCALTVVSKPQSMLRGVVLQCDKATLRTLDKREDGYSRKEVNVVLDTGHRSRSWLYVGRRDRRVDGEDGYSIWMSYLLVVLAGYLELGGPRALQDFYGTTVGWNMPVEHDEREPKYTRAFRLKPGERAQIRRFLSSRGIKYGGGKASAGSA